MFKWPATHRQNDKLSFSLGIDTNNVVSQIFPLLLLFLLYSDACRSEFSLDGKTTPALLDFDTHDTMCGQHQLSGLLLLFGSY